MSGVSGGDDDDRPRTEHEEELDPEDMEDIEEGEGEDDYILDPDHVRCSAICVRKSTDWLSSGCVGMLMCRHSDVTPPH